MFFYKRVGLQWNYFLRLSVISAKSMSASFSTEWEKGEICRKASSACFRARMRVWSSPSLCWVDKIA